MPDKTQKPPAVTVKVTPGPGEPGPRAAWDKLWRKLLVEAREGQK